jgi:hypothetical protein
MATMHPPRFPYPRDPKRKAEGQFYRACEEQLGDEWTVMYEQRWYGLRNGRNQRGEADFLMFSPSAGAFVVEVKGGEVIGVENGEWYTVPHGTSTKVKIKNPFTQAADSKSVLWDLMREHLPDLRLKGELGHMVVFPGHVQHGDMSMQARRQLICDRQDMKSLQETMNRVARYSGQTTRWSEGDIRRIAGKLMPSFVLLGSKRPDLDEFFDQLNMLTEMQLTAFSMLRNHDRLNVHGGAGTGKTVLAFHRAIELSLEGKTVLYLCHSIPLASYLRQELDKRSIAGSGSLKIQSVGELLEPFEDRLLQRQEEPGFNLWEAVYECFIELSMTTSEMVDALIIDEAQSIQMEVGEAVRVLLRDNGHLYVFGDVNQTTLTHDEGSVLAVFGHASPLELNVNCRSSLQIADFAHSVVHSKTQALGSGFAEVSMVVSPFALFSQRIAEIVKDWVTTYGVDISDIRLLVPTPYMAESFLRYRENPLNHFGVHVTDDFAIDWIPSGGSREFGFFVGSIDVWKEFLASVETDGLSAGEINDAFEDWFWEREVEKDAKSAADCDVQTEPSESEDQWFARIAEEFDERRKQLDALGLPIVSSMVYEEFIGLEAQAVVMVLPLARFREVETATNSRRRFALETYAMATRARALLAVVGEESSFELLEWSRQSLKLDL